jgi:murein hydrolase activator
MKWYTKIAVVICFFLSLSSVQAQDKTALQSKYNKLQDEIKDAQDLLSETQKKKKNTLGQVKLLDRKIDVREEMIQNLSFQVHDVSKEIKEAATTITTMEENLADMRDDYAKMIFYAYVNDKEYEPMHFIFASGSINDAYTEVEYVREYTTYRKQQAAAIKAAQAALKNRKEQLEKDIVNKQDLLVKEQDQRNVLAKEKEQHDQTVKSLQGEEKKLKAEIDKKKKDANALNKQIQNIIAEEIRKEKERAEAEAKKAAAEKAAKEKASAGSTTTSTGTTAAKEEKAAPVITGLTPEMELIGKNFAGNKGRLPWPVERGTITGRYGTHPHPVLKNVTVENNGIDITTTKGSTVRSLFEGEVVNVIFNPSFQKGVIIKHGEYYTVYTGLTSLNVKAGDKVNTKQSIGTVYTSDDDRTEVHLEIWKGTTLMDPSGWITK